MFRAARLIEMKLQLGKSCDCHAYLSVKHGSVISSKSPSEGQRALSRGKSKYARRRNPGNAVAE